MALGNCWEDLGEAADKSPAKELKSGCCERLFLYYVSGLQIRHRAESEGTAVCSDVLPEAPELN